MSLLSTHPSGEQVEAGAAHVRDYLSVAVSRLEQRLPHACEHAVRHAVLLPRPEPAARGSPAKRTRCAAALAQARLGRSGRWLGRRAWLAWCSSSQSTSSTPSLASASAACTTCSPGPRLAQRMHSPSRCLQARGLCGVRRCLQPCALQLSAGRMLEALLPALRRVGCTPARHW